MNAGSSKQGAAGAQRWVLPLLMLLFIGPVVAAAYFYYFGGGWRPAASVNHGRLLSPPMSLANVALPSASGAMTKPGFLRGQWSIVYINDSNCAADCREVLDKTRRVRLALREKSARVQRVLLYTGSPPDDEFLNSDQAGLIAVSASGSAGVALVKSLSGSGEMPLRGIEFVFLVDPLGNAMLAYEPGFEMKGMLEDLKRLLKLSRIG